MGMYLLLANVSDATIARLHTDPPLVEQILEPGDPDAVARARGRPPGPGLFGRLLGRKAPPPPPAPPPLELQPGEGDLGPDGDLEKMWHGIHYLLTGTAWEGDPPLNFLLAGGRELDIEIGIGPPRTFSAAEVQVIAAALAQVDDAELRRRFSSEAMMQLDIYPGIWDRSSEVEKPLEFLIESIAGVRQAFARMVAQEQGLLIVHT